MIGKSIPEMLILLTIPIGLVLACLEEFQIHTDNHSIIVQKYPNNESEIVQLTITCCLISSIYEYNYTFGHLNVPQTLIITNMKISQIPVLPKLTGITEVKFVGLQDNVVSAGAFKNLPKLKKLDFTNSATNKIPNIKLGVVGTLENFTFSGNGITKVDVIFDAEEIHLNRISMITVPFENVKVLDLTNGLLDTLKKSYFKHPQKLEKLCLSSNRISRIFHDSFSNMLSLENLRLDYNQITTLDTDVFRDLVNLKILNLYHNQIRNLQLGIFDNLINLEHLDIGNNLIKVLDEGLLNPLVNLKIFYINRNQIDWWEIREIKMHNPNLTEVNLMWNDWICGDLAFILKHLVKQNITFHRMDAAFDPHVERVPCTDRISPLPKCTN